MNADEIVEEVIPHLDGNVSYDEIAAVETCREVWNEVRRAMVLHKGINSLHEGYAVILEEMDEFWEQVKINPKKLSAADQGRRIKELRKELIQVAAMCERTIVDQQMAKRAARL